ncbi:MAG: PLP-dependent aminotransferase family protein [Myxococcales bacterium]|nr:PLP-dependent aminotransferase family protein [Myxococcales bacterium]
MTSILVAVDRRSRQPLYRQIYERVRSRVLRGELRPGELVPSTRELSRELGVSRIPVLNAYEQLLAEGYFESRAGAGTWVSSSLAGGRPATPKPRGERRVSKHAAALPPYQRPVWAENLGPFQVGQPDLHRFPIRTWARLVARYTRNMRVRALQYGDALGLPELREAIAAYARRSRGVRCEAGQVVILSGSQQALDLATRVLLDDGDAAWVEEPGYWLVHHVLKAAGCRASPVPVDAQGLDVAAGEELCRRARAAFVAPSHQYPLGVTMSAARRMQLLAWAQRAGAWIVEDDYDSEYRYDSMPIASLQGMDANGRVIYAGTFSKVMFPSLRLGYLIVPSDLVERFAAMRRAIDLCPPNLTQAVMAEFIAEGHFARHIRRMRPVYASRRRVLVEAVEREFGGSAQLVGDEAGMHVALLLECDDVRLAAAAGRRGIQVSPLSASYTGPPARRGFVLGFGNAAESRIAPAVRLLRNLTAA